MMTLTCQKGPKGSVGTSSGQVTRDGPVVNKNDHPGPSRIKAKIKTTSESRASLFLSENVLLQQLCSSPFTGSLFTFNSLIYTRFILT